MAADSSEPGTNSPPLLEKIREALAQTQHVWLQRLEVKVVEDSVLLAGKVPSFYLKQLAQAASQAVPGVGIVRNTLEVGT